jgi:hypothetical protein
LRARIKKVLKVRGVGVGVWSFIAAFRIEFIFLLPRRAASLAVDLFFWYNGGGAEMTIRGEVEGVREECAKEKFSAPRKRSFFGFAWEI